MVRRLPLSLAAAHEALYPRLESLCRQVEAIAARKPDAPVPPVTRATAEALLFDALRFGRSPRHAFPPAPDTHAALATLLGQALAALDAFEARHSAWSAAHAGFVWHLIRGEQRLVARLRPKSLAPAAVTDDRRAAERRADLIRRIEARYEDGFEAGVASATRTSPVETFEARRP